MEYRTPLRRRPAQQRSVERVQRMLDACAALLDEVGYEGLSTTGIAARAEVAIGSVYQFFPDKRAVAHALALRNLELFSARVEALYEGGGLVDWADSVGQVIEVFVEMHRTVPGFRVLRFGDIADVRLLDERTDNNAIVARGLRELIVRHFDDAVDGPELDRALAVAVEAGDAVLKMAFRRDPDGDPRIIAEAERLIHAYLAAHLREPPEPGGATPGGVS